MYKKLPAFMEVPSIIEASISIFPAAFRHEPFPASNAGSSSSSTIAVSTASRADPPCFKISYALKAANLTPFLLASLSFCGIA